MTTPDVTIVGAGIVGLATARALKIKNPQLCLRLVEKESGPASHQTGHNSGVIHAGLYYVPGSAKARLAVHGRKLLLDYAARRRVPHELCGKVVVATSEVEVERLQKLWTRGQNNGLAGLKKLGKPQLLEREPYANGSEAILVPEEGIIDYKAMSRALAEELVDLDVELRYSTKVLKITEVSGELHIETSSGSLKSRRLLACGGLQSDRLIRAHGLKSPVQIVPFRGEYYDLTSSAESMVKHLIYPVPDPDFPFLGVHFTRMVAGGVECGPNAVLGLAREGYSKWAFSAKDTWDTFSYPGFWKFGAKHWRQGLAEQYRSLSKDAFVCALQKLLPAIRSEHLVPGGCGIRAQAMGPSGKLVDDFEFLNAGKCFFVLNAPSPAATASLAIGEEIASRFEMGL